MKILKAFVTLVFISYSHISYSSIISADLDFLTPSTITSPVDIIANFGMSGENIDINNLSLSMTFEGNLLEDQFGYSYLANVTNHSEPTAWLSSGRDIWGGAVSQLSIRLDTLHIDNNGFAYFRIGLGGDGAHVTDMSLTGNATVVPLPSAFFLLVSGLVAFLSLAKKR